MRTIIKICTLWAFFLLGTKQILAQHSAIVYSTSAIAGKPTKYGYINAMEILESLPEFAKAKKDFEAYGKSLQLQVKEFETDLDEKIKKYQKEETKFSKELNQARAEQVKNDRARLNLLYTQVEQNLDKKRAELMGPMYTKLNQALKQVAESKKIALVFDAAAIKDALLIVGDKNDFLADGINLSKMVKRRLSKN